MKKTIIILFLFCQCVVMTKVDFQDSLETSRISGQLEAYNQALKYTKNDEMNSLLLGQIDLDSMKLLALKIRNGYDKH